MPGAVLIRPAAGAAELAAAGDVALRAYLADGLVAAGSPYAATLRDAAARAAGAEVLVAVDGSAVLGTVTVITADGPLREISREGEAEFRMLAVAPEAAGCGVGAALVGDVAARVRAAGFTRLVCSSRPAMRAAHRLYVRLGFTRAPERDWAPAPGIDLIVFELAL